MLPSVIGGPGGCFIFMTTADRSQLLAVPPCRPTVRPRPANALANLDEALWSTRRCTSVPRSGIPPASPEKSFVQTTAWVLPFGDPGRSRRVRGHLGGSAAVDGASQLGRTYAPSWWHCGHTNFDATSASGTPGGKTNPPGHCLADAQPRPPRNRPQRKAPRP
jgi:hypothetical protein